MIRIIAKMCLLVAFLFAAVTAQAGNILSNGDFQTGTLPPWTPFTTTNGTNGAGLPDVVFFNTTGTGPSLAAQFDVGEVAYTGLPEGGAIDESFTLSSGGTFTFFANIASQDDANHLVNADAGTYSILIDGVPLASDNLGGFSSVDQILMGTLSGSVSLSAGAPTLEV